MTKRIQIPIDEPELALVRAAANRAGLPVAEWARAVLHDEAERTLSGAKRTPREALEHLFSLEAPIDDLDVMIEQSIAGRLR